MIVPMAPDRPRLPGAAARISDRDGGGDGPYRVGLGRRVVVAWIGMVLFVGSMIGTFLANQYRSGLLFLALAVLDAFILISAGDFTFDRDGVTSQCWIGTYRMLWRDVRKMETGAGVLILIGDNSRFVIAPPSGWSGAQKGDAWRLLVQEMAATGIVPSPSRTAAYKWYRNVRLRQE